jgi:hypothetical protein
VHNTPRKLEVRRYKCVGSFSPVSCVGSLSPVALTVPGGVAGQHTCRVMLAAHYVAPVLLMALVQSSYNNAEYRPEPP